MDKRKFEEKIEKSIDNAAAHFEQRVESVAAKAEKRIEAAADRFDKSVERATGTRAGKIAVFCINVVIAIALITGGFFFCTMSILLGQLSALLLRLWILCGVS